jgi:adenine-specific DNA-methyltransferase
MYKFPKINFIGNKEKIAHWISEFFPSDATSLFDAFSGGTSVSYQAKIKGLQVFSNDVLTINYQLSKALIENKTEKLDATDIELIFSGEPQAGFMFENYANQYFFPDECMELDLYRTNIEKLSSDYKKALAFAVLRRAMIRKMPYSRFNIQWDKVVQLRDEQYSYDKYKRKRAYHNQSLKSHFLENLNEYNHAIFDNGQENMAFNDNIFNLLGKVKADIIYLDPPYSGTMNNYFEFYGLIDEYIAGEKKQAFENNFIDKKTVGLLFDKLFANLVTYKYWILSYNNASFPSKNQLVALLSQYSDDIQIIEKDHVYKITGKDKKQANTEYLFVVKNTKFIENPQPIIQAEYAEL